MVNYSEIVNLQRELFTQGIKVPLSEEDRAALEVNAETVYFKGTDVFVDGEKVKDPIYRKLFREYCFGFDPLILLGGETIPIDRAREKIKSIPRRDVKFRICTREGERPIIEFREPLPKHLKEEIERELGGFYRIEYSGCKKTKLAAFGIIGLIAGAASAGIYCGLACGYKNSSNSMVKLEKNDKPLVRRNTAQQKLTKLAKDDVKPDEVKLSVAVEDGKSGKYCPKARYSNETLIKGEKSVSPDFKLNRTKKKMQKRDKERLNLEAKIMRDVKACSDQEAWDILIRSGKETPAKMSDIQKELAKGLRSYAADSEYLSAIVVEYAAETISADDVEQMRTAIGECRDLLGAVLHPLFEEKSYATQKLYDLMRFWEERLYQEGVR